MCMIKKEVFVILISLLLLLNNDISLPAAQSIASSVQVFTSQPEDKFIIAVYNNWESKIMSSSGGKTYVFWDNVGNAISINVKIPKDFEKLLNSIAEDKISKKELSKIQNVFRMQAPLKEDLSLDISIVSNKKTLTQIYLYRQETLDTVYFIKNISHDFLHSGQQYTISYSSSPAPTKEAAKKNFEESFQRYFKPMLITFFIN